MPLKAYILSIVGSKQLSNKLKTTPKVLLRTLQAAAALPTTPATEENNEDLIKTIRKFVREEVKDLQENLVRLLNLN